MLPARVPARLSPRLPTCVGGLVKN